MKIHFFILILLTVSLGIFIFFNVFNYVSAEQYYSDGGKPFIEDDSGILVMRAAAPTAAGVCPVGWTNGGTGSAYYDQGSQTNERYCY